MTKIFKNNEIVEMTAEEQTIFDESQVAIQAEETRVANEEQAKADLKASAKAKLVAGEALTQEEADTIVL